MTESKTGMSFSRRNFIKGAAALTATGALVGCAPAKETLAETGEEPVEVPETQIYAGACRAQCGQGCYLNVHVRDGRVVRTTAGHFDDGPSSTVSARRDCPTRPRVQRRATAVPHASCRRARQRRVRAH
ncbi:MAG: twin-arginine translocation signal domain-containing protein [Adlercreutzia equolifaciens]